MLIGIGINTQNRRDDFLLCLENIKKYMPDNAILRIVDDASDVPCPEADFRFDEVQGIAKAKNKTLELLDGCEHIFLFDDDTWPTEMGWEKPYINSPENHLMYLFKHQFGNSYVDYEDDRHVSWITPCGCLLYYKRKALDTVGGFDPIYGRWGSEHGDLSSRIHCAGLTSFRYMDVKDAKIYCLDEAFPYEHKRTVPDDEIWAQQHTNGKRHTERYADNDTRYIEFRNLRNVSFTPDDISTPGAQVQTVTYDSPFDRYIKIRKYLQEHRDVEFCFALGTGVTQSVDPWWDVEAGRLYVSYKPATAAKITGYPAPKILEFSRMSPSSTLLDSSVFGGDRETVISLCNKILKEYYLDPGHAGPDDKGWFNVVARDFPLVYGPGITSNDEQGWFKLPQEA